MNSVAKKHLALFGLLVFVVLAISAVGCRPPPPPAPTPQPTPVAQPTRPAYQPTTEEWVHMPTRINYERGSSRLTDPHRAMLNEAHASMTARTDIVRVRIEGHADDGGSQERNNLLANERAMGVMDYLTGHLNMPRELFEVQSYGNDQPLTSGTTGADDAVNRRVEFTILVRRQASY